MKEFKKVTKNDLLLEFLNYANEKLCVDITKVKAKEYNDDDSSSSFADYRSKSMFIKLNSCEYYVNLFYACYGDNEITFNVYKIINRKKGLLEKIFQEVK